MIFISDHTFIKKDEAYYTTGSLNTEILSRYKEMVGDIIVIGYVKEFNASLAKYIKKGNIAEGVDFILFPKTNNPLQILKNFSKIKKIINKNQPVIIRMSILGLLASKFCKKNKINYLIEVVASTWDSLWFHSLKGKLVAPFIDLATKKSIRNAPFVIYVTEKYLQSKYPTKGKNIGCSDVMIKVNYQNIKNKITKTIFDKNNFSLCTLANIEVKYKGQKDVIKAIKYLSAYGINVKYYLIGAGNKERLLNVAKKYNIEENIVFLGQIPHENVLLEMSKYDIYIQPSYQEGLPRAMIEAMSIGMPCIGSDAGGICELLNRKYIFKKGNYKEIIHLLSSLTENEVKKMSIENLNTSIKFDNQNISKKRSEFYRNSLFGENYNE